VRQREGNGMKMIGLVIHLERATARRAVAMRLVEECGLPAQLLAAVDGRSLSPAIIEARLLRDPIHPVFPHALRAGEVGCFLSHRLAWQSLLESDADAALILEDDAALGPEFPAALRLAARNLGAQSPASPSSSAMGYIQFQTRLLRNQTALDAEGPCQLYQPIVTPLRTTGQLVNRRAAEHLLELTWRFDRPVDTFLQMHWHTGLRLACIAPSGLSDVSAVSGGSTLKLRHNFGDRLSREWNRFRYRRAVQRASAKAVQ